MAVARVNIALRCDYLGIGKRTKEGDEKRDVVLSGKNRRRGEISSGVCRRRRVWLHATPQPPPLHLLHYGRAPRRGGTRASIHHREARIAFS
jgi:hypothetical protein